MSRAEVPDGGAGTAVSLGLCSVTLRAQAVPEVARLASRAKLECIEWGGDLHVPPGDARAVSRAVDASAKYGLRVASYGSYFRPGVDADRDFDAVLQSAVGLGAPRIRIWAGAAGSATATPEHWRSVVQGVRAAAAKALEHGVSLAFEFHARTLADTPDAVVRLLREAALPNVQTYWQPPVGLPDAAALAGLEAVLGHLAAVHVFSWWPEIERHPLQRRAGLWRAALAIVRRGGAPCDALLEFLPGDDPDLLADEAASLSLLLRGAG